ncbi:MAG: ABC transporter permease [Candidatus Bathyarchaeia archaeon]
MKWVYRRILGAAITLFSTINIIFFLIRLMPGNPIDFIVTQYIEAGVPYEEAYRFVSTAFGIELNKPLHLQYIDFIFNLLKGSLGNSIVYRTPVSQIIFSALPWTIFTVSLGLSLSFLGGVFLGLLSAYKRNSVIDKILQVLSVSSVAIPNYIFAYIFIIIFCRMLNLFPMMGAYDSLKVKPGFNLPFILNVMHHAILPILCYFIAGFGAWLLRMRGTSVSVLGEYHISFARLRGLSSNRIMWKYVGRNAILPVFAIFAINVGYIFGGSTLIENIFRYPGVGLYISRAVSNRDYTLMQGIFFLLTFSVIVSNLIADLLYSFLDPRVKTE